MMGLSLIDSKLCKETLGINEESLVYINNTSNVGLDVMRPSLLVSGLISIAHNINRQQNSLKFYEIGKCYTKNGDEYTESEKLSIFITGTKEGNWNSPQSYAYTFHDIKNSIDLIVDHLGVKNIEISEAEEEGLSYGLTYTSDKKPLVSFGEVDKITAKKTGVKQTVYYAEFDIASIMKTQINKTNYVSEISKFPTVKRDLALVIDQGVNFEAIQNAIKDTKQKYLTSIRLFDIYKNEEVLGKGKKSYALNFSFENLEATLTEKEIESSMTKIVKACQEKLGAVIRQ
jgi:phenylalanyl-tRNA synthetase beta chain